MLSTKQHNDRRGWQMKLGGLAITFGVFLVMSMTVSVAWAELPEHVTERFGEVLKADIDEVDGNWVDVSPESSVQINTVTQEVTFNIIGLTPDAQLLAKGVVVCQASGEARRVDTPGVAVNSMGVASFSGKVHLPQVCATSPHDIAFFVRTFSPTATTFFVSY